MNGIEIKCERIRAKIPQYRLAAKLGITQTELSQYESERKPLPIQLENRIRKTIEKFTIRTQS
jgi:transcriptional regulator with XRE-family HTH domain